MFIDKQEKYVIYRIKNKLNGNFYVGSSGDVAERWRVHRNNIESFKGGNKPGRDFYNLTLLMRMDIELNKFSTDDFEFKILRRFDDKKSMLACEQLLIDMFWNTRKCYNEDFEVKPASIFNFFVAWNAVTYSYYVYRSIHALKSDLRIPLAEINAMLNGDTPCCGDWVVEDYYKVWTELELKSFFRKNRFKYSKEKINKERYSVVGPTLFNFLTKKEIFIHKWNRQDNKKITMKPSNYFRKFQFGPSGLPFPKIREIAFAKR
ncbi:MAG: GIY-YIG nuclease family protein [Burkholderiaceae bacterium]|nr:GIY-YIG nuclease family protein [Burkholderiaceae bacterium]